MRNIYLLWTSILLGNYYVRADEVYFQLLDTNQTDDKSYFYNIINFPNDSISLGDNKSSGAAPGSSEDILTTTEETPIFTEYGSVNVDNLSDYGKVKDIPDFNFTSPLEEWNVPEPAWTDPPELDIFKDIPDDLFKDSPNVIRVTVEIPSFEEDEYYKPVTYRNSTTTVWFKVFGFVLAIIACLIGAFLKCIRKQTPETNPDDRLKTIILIVPKSQKV